MRSKPFSLLVAAFATCGAIAQIELLSNGGMELGDGAGAIDEQVPANWTEFGINVERSPTVNFAPAGPGHSLKAFGDGTSNTAGAEQIKTGVSPGQSVSLTARLHTPGFDKLGGSGVAGIEMEFLNAFNGIINPPATLSSFVVNSGSPADTWILATIGPVIAPANTAKVRIRCRLNWTPGNVFGAVYWDDVQLTINAGSNQAVNGDFETAGPSPGQSAYGITDWIGFNDQEKSNLAARTGSFSVQIGTREAYNGLFQNFGVVNAGERLVLTCYVRNPSNDPLTGASRAGMKLEFDPNFNVPPPQEELTFTAAAPEDLWTPVTLSTTVPNGVTGARIVLLYFGDSGTTGAAYVDSASAKRGSAPTVNQLTNPSFEDNTGGVPDNWTHFFSGGSSEMLGSCFNGFEHSGDCAARGAGTAVAGLYQEIAVTQGESLEISAQFYSSSFEPFSGANSKAGVKVEWIIGGVPADIDIGTPGNGNTIGAGAPTNTWIPLTIDYTMPPNSSAIARFVLLTEKSTGLSGKVYFDDCSALVYGRCDPCDVDCNGTVNPFDIQPFVNLLSGAGSPCSPCAADVDGNGTVNPFDITPFLNCLAG